VQALVICAGVAGVISQVLLVSSLATFQGPTAKPVNHVAIGVADFLKSPAAPKWWKSFVGLQVVRRAGRSIFQIASDW
jgi:hypothetical protein